MSEGSRLNLPLDERSRSWIVLRDVALNDEALRSIIRTYLVWDGETSISRADDAGSMSPILRMTPVIGQQSWYDPSSQAGYLQVNILITIQTPYIVDALSIWGAFERAYYPTDREKRLAIERVLVDAGAETGQVEFTTPAADQDPRISDDGLMLLRGAMRLRVIRSLDP